MAVAFRSASSGTDLTTALPAGNAAGDVLLAQVTTETDGTTPTAATGWTLIDGVTTCAQVGRPLSCHWYWIARGGSAPATNWSTGGASTPQVSYLCYSGADTVDPIDDFIKNSTASGADTVWELLTFTNNTDQSMQIAMGGVNQWTTSTSTLANERVDGGATISAHFYDNGLVGTGSVAAGTITCGEGWHDLHLALKPSSGAVAGETTPGPTRVGGGPGGLFSVDAFQWVQQTGSDASGTVEAVAAGSSASSGDVTATVEHVVTASGSSTTSGTVTAVVTKEATASGSSATSGTVTAVVTVEAIVTGSSATSGTATATVEHIVSATATGSSATSGTVTAVVTVEVTAAGSSSTSGTATAVVTVEAVASGSSSTSGSATATVQTAGTVEAVGTGSSATSGTATAVVTVEAVAAGSSATSGTVTAVVTVPVTANGSSATSGTVTAVVTIPAVATGSSATSGTATATVFTPSVIQAVATGTSATSGTATALASGALPPLTPPFAALIVGYTSSTTDVGPRSSTAVTVTTTSTVNQTPRSSTVNQTPEGVT